MISAGSLQPCEHREPTEAAIEVRAQDHTSSGKFPATVPASRATGCERSRPARLAAGSVATRQERPAVPALVCPTVERVPPCDLRTRGEEATPATRRNRSGVPVPTNGHLPFDVVHALIGDIMF